MRYGPTRIIYSTRETCPDCGVALSKYPPRTHKMTKRQKTKPSPRLVHIALGIYEDTFGRKKQCDICLRVSTGQWSFRVQAHLVLDGSMRSESSVVEDESPLFRNLRIHAPFQSKWFALCIIYRRLQARASATSHYTYANYARNFAPPEAIRRSHQCVFNRLAVLTYSISRSPISPLRRSPRAISGFATSANSLRRTYCQQPNISLNRNG